MTVKIKKGDFIKLDFIGRSKINGQIFDLTIAKVAKDEGIFREDYEYKPTSLRVGSGHVLPGLDEFLEGKEINKEYELDITQEKGFGKRNPKLVRIVSLSLFKSKKVNPVPGMQLNLDGQIATIRSVNGGRVVVDFNPILAGRDLHYWIKVIHKITDIPEKAQVIFKRIGFMADNIKFKDGELILSLKNKEKLGKPFLDILEKEVKKQIPAIKKVRFR